MITVAALVWGFLIGGIPSGLLLSKWIAGRDPRDTGSGSSGATNVSRVLGKKWGAVVLLVDAAKGFAATALFPLVYCSACAVPGSEVLAAFGAVVGHAFTPYAGFRGGKGVATAAGAMVALDWRSLLLTLAVWAIVFLIARRVSPASILAAISFPVLMSLDSRAEPALVVWGAAAIALFIVYTHRGNIARLMRGDEPRYF